MRKTEPHMNCQSRHDDLSNRVSDGALLIRCCSLNIITTIKEKLNKENLKAFEDSCFGHLLEMNPLCFQGPLLRHLLLHINTAASNNTLIFNINNSKLEFGPRHFQLITGLRFGASEAVTRTTTATSSGIHKDVFGGRPAISFKDVEEAFLDVCRDHKGEGELTLKLALLYFLYGVVLPASYHKRRKIELRYLHLADDLRVFRLFPWGRIGYELLVSSVLSARLCLDGSSATRIFMPGFTFALQVWAYENMPSLATYCAAPSHNFQSSTMRILNWSATKFIRFDKLERFFTLAVGGDNEVLSAEASLEQLNMKVEPLTSTSISQEERRKAQSEDVVESLPRESDQPIPNTKLHRNEWGAAEVEDEERVKEATPVRRSRMSRNPISTNKLQSSLPETERIKSIVALAFDDNPALDMPQPLGKTFDFEISVGEYERIKVLYEALLDRTKRLKLFVSYAQFEAFAVVEGSQIRDKIKCIQRGRAVFERGLSYFRSCAPEMKEERAMLLEEWFDMEYRFGEVGDVGSIRAKLPQKLKKRRRVQTEDGKLRYEEYIDYDFPEEKDVEV